MSQNNSNDKAAMLAKIEGINKVEGFDPTPFAVDYTDLETGEVRKRLPVMIQMAWFRMKYPEGRMLANILFRINPSLKIMDITLNNEGCLHVFVYFKILVPFWQF